MTISVAAVIRAMLAVSAMILLGTYYFQRKKSDRVKALACKAGATAMPGLLLLCYGMENGGLTAAGYWTLAAVLFYMAADVLLECRFVWGAVSFAVGHLCMIAGFVAGMVGGGITQGECIRFLRIVVILFCVYVGAACLALRRYIPHLRAKKLFLPAAAYLVILSAMAACAASAGSIKGGISGAVLAAGGICFVVSDVLLGQNRLGRKRSRVKGAAVLVLYYLAVYLFAAGIWID